MAAAAHDRLGMTFPTADNDLDQGGSSRLDQAGSIKPCVRHHAQERFLKAIMRRRANQRQDRPNYPFVALRYFVVTQQNDIVAQ
jgi:hypothetical protein